MKLLTTGELAQELGVSRGAVNKWQNQKIITPALTTPGGHHRWDLDAVRAQLLAVRERDTEG